MKRVVYTVVVENYDSISPIRFKSDCDFYIFTDDSTVKVAGWKTIYLNPSIYPELSSSDINRQLKIFTPKECLVYDQSLYLDGHVMMNRDPSFLFDKYLAINDIAMPPHPFRKCFSEEAEYCVAYGIANKELVLEQINKYKNLGFPRDFGLTENGIILRNHSCEAIRHLMDEWWHEYKTGPKRDQLSLPFLLWRNQITPGLIREGPRFSARYFTLKPHSIRKLDRLRSLIWHIQAHQKRNIFYQIGSNMIDRAIRIASYMKN